MLHPYSVVGGRARFLWLLLPLLLALPGRAGAQTSPPPPWELAVSSGPNQPAAPSYSVTQAAAVDGAGNMYVTGYFYGSVTFGSTRLTSMGNDDMFVAKWDAAARAFTWAASGGGTGTDRGLGVAVSGKNVYVTGFLDSGRGASIAGQALGGTGLSIDLYVAKYVDTSMGSTAGFANGWAVSGGGTGTDQGTGIAVSGADVYVTGYFGSGQGASIAGRALPGTGVSNDMFVAKYVDTSTGSSQQFANGWAVSGGGGGEDKSFGIAVNNKNVYVTGSFTTGLAASIAGQPLAGTDRSVNMFVAKYVDTSTAGAQSYANGWATSGGGNGYDQAYAIAVEGTGIYVTGVFDTNTGASFAGQTLPGAGFRDMFVAKYVDTSTGSTQSFADGWAISGGGTNNDLGLGIAVSGRGVFVTGCFFSGSNAVIAGQVLAGAGTTTSEVFVAKYVDTSTGGTQNVANAWATSGGGAGDDSGNGVVVSGQQVYAVGGVLPPATFGGFTLSKAASDMTDFLSRLSDATLTPLPTRGGQPAAPLALYPNPTATTATLTGVQSGATVQVLDGLGRLVLTAMVDATGTALLQGLASLPAGLYLVRTGPQTVRLVVD